jgi:hypothetical protein
MVCVSIIGRQFDGFAFFRPVRGDYELVELGCVIAVCAFLPWCQLKRGHVAVDIVVQALPGRAKAFSGPAWRYPHFHRGLRDGLAALGRVR